MPDFTQPHGISYPLADDTIKSTTFAAKLASDIKSTALTADLAITAEGVRADAYTDGALLPLAGGKVTPKLIPDNSDILTLAAGWWYARPTSSAATLTNRPPGVAAGPFMLRVMRTSFNYATATFYGYSGTAGGVYENHTGTASGEVWVGWNRLDNDDLSPLRRGHVTPGGIIPGVNLDALRDSGWYYVRLTSDAATITNRPPGIGDGPFMVHVVTTPFNQTTQTFYGYSGSAAGVYSRQTGNALGTIFTQWARLDGGGGTAAAVGVAGAANPLRVQQFRDAYPPITTGGKGAVALRFDHGLANFNSKMRALLDARNIPYSLALSARNFNAGENFGVTASMVNGWAGAEVWNHGANQHQDESTLAGLTDQLVTGLEELQAMVPDKKIWGYAVPGTGGTGQGGFGGGSTPESFYGTTAGDLILTHHAVSTGAFPGTARRRIDGRVRQGQAHFTMEAQTVARIKTEIDNAITNKTGNQLMMHPSLLDTAGYITTAQFTEVLDYIVAKRTAGELVVLSPYEMMLASTS